MQVNTYNLAQQKTPNNFYLSPLIQFLAEVIPSSYIFRNNGATNRTDLIIVMDQYHYKPFDEIHTLLDFALLGHERLNCTVYTYGTIYELLSKGHLFFSNLCTPKNCVYQSNPYFNLPLLHQEKRNELVEKSKLVFNQNMQKAITFFKGACEFANENESTISAFMLQQACELTYRSLLLSLRGKQVKCHDLIVLRKHLRHFAPTIIGILDKDEEKEIALLATIQEAYIKSRYDQTYRISLNELKTSISAADQLIQSAQKIFNCQCEKILSP
ncbi:MAG: HEPN domain-containing protein [Chitinophagaceae bacterium]|nr:MAG: HEPN domain-containing protein [Chitinophagaceae bacterium]